MDTATLLPVLPNASQTLGVIVGLLLWVGTILGLVTLFPTEHLVISGLLLFVAASTIGFVISVGLQRWTNANGIPSKSKALALLVLLSAVLLFASQLLVVDSTLQTALALAGFIGLGAGTMASTIVASTTGAMIAHGEWAKRQARKRQAAR